jgi:hypothetical protein
LKSYIGIPLPTVEKVYDNFISSIGNNNKMDKKEFRRLYKEMYLNGQNGTNSAPFLTDHDLDKMSDHVFETYDIDGSGFTFYLRKLNKIFFSFFYRKINFRR